MRVRHLTTLKREDTRILGPAPRLRQWKIDPDKALPEWADEACQRWGFFGVASRHGDEIEGILLTMYDGRTRLASQVADEVRTHFGAQVLTTVIPRNVRVSEAPSYSQSVLTYDPASPGALAYREAAAEVVILDGSST